MLRTGWPPGPYRRLTAASFAIAVMAALAAGTALGVALHHSGPSFPLVCGQEFLNNKTGQTIPTYVPCSTTRP